MEPFDEDLHRKRIDTITDELQRLAKALGVPVTELLR